MKLLFWVSSEGGPLLLSDGTAAKTWRGAEGDAIDYDKLCAGYGPNPTERGLSFLRGGLELLAWDCGAGSFCVLQGDPGEIVLLRTDTEDDAAEPIETLASLPTAGATELGCIETPSGRLAIMWAAESGEFLEEHFPGAFREFSEHSAVGGSVFSLVVRDISFTCLEDELKWGADTAIRLRLVPRVKEEASPPR